VEKAALSGVSDDTAKFVIGVGEQLLERNPLREPLYRALIHLRALNNDRAGALKLYSDCAKILKQELGVEPELATKELYREIQSKNATLQAAPPEPLLSIVVLPFANMSEDPHQQHFADGLTEDITVDLSRVAGSFVIARSTAMTYKGKSVDAKSVARELGVRYVLDGSVRRHADHVRVTVQLINGASGANVWANRFDHSISELWRCQDDVTRRIAQILNLELIDAESRRSKRDRPVNPNAVDLALQGWSLFNQPASKARLERARTLFETSISMDGSLISALVGLANVCMAEVDRGWSDDADQDVKQAEGLVSRAVIIDPKLGAAECVKSRILAYHSQLPEAIKAAEAAIDLNRNDSMAHRLLALYELQSGRPERCRALIEQDLRLSPRDPNRWGALIIIARAQIALGECEEALANLSHALAINPDIHFARIWFATAYGRMGKDEEARKAIAEFLASVPVTTGQSQEIKTTVAAQLELAAQGYYLGIIDGRMGPFGQQAIREFQRDRGLPLGGVLDSDTLAALMHGKQ
jgi:adenylate cyclase